MKIAVVGPYATPDGIAIYLEDIFYPISKDYDVKIFCSRDFAHMSVRREIPNLPCWDKGGNNVEEVIQNILEFAPDIVHLQLHESYFQLQATKLLIETLNKKGFKIVATFHNVVAPGFDLKHISKTLKKVDKVISLSSEDTEYLRSFGVACEYLPHPYWKYELPEKESARKTLMIQKHSPIIATHGLVNSNKGLMAVAEAVALLKKTYPHILWMALNAVHTGSEVSVDVAKQLDQRILGLGISENIYWYKDFIDSNEVVAASLSLADVGILAYKDVGESASGAIRKFAAAKLPSIVSNIKQFGEISDICWQLPKNEEDNSLQIAEAVIKLLADKAARILQQEKMTDLLETYSWEKAVTLHLDIYKQAVLRRTEIS